MNLPTVKVKGLARLHKGCGSRDFHFWPVVYFMVYFMVANDSQFYTPTYPSLAGQTLYPPNFGRGSVCWRFVMARRSGSSRTFRNDPQLQQYFLEGVAPTGKTLGVGSYGSVVEVWTGSCLQRRVYTYSIC